MALSKSNAALLVEDAFFLYALCSGDDAHDMRFSRETTMVFVNADGETSLGFTDESNGNFVTCEPGPANSYYTGFWV